jgi:hypothetical protein
MLFNAFKRGSDRNVKTLATISKNVLGRKRRFTRSVTKDNKKLFDRQNLHSFGGKIPGDILHIIRFRRSQLDDRFIFEGRHIFNKLSIHR